RRGRADVLRETVTRRGFGVLDRAAARQVDALGPRDEPERISGERLPGLAVEHVYEAAALGTDQQLPLSALPLHVDEDTLVDRIVVVLVVRHELIRPHGFAGIRVTGENRRRPLVVARPQGGIPHA